MYLVLGDEQVEVFILYCRHIFLVSAPFRFAHCSFRYLFLTNILSFLHWPMYECDVTAARPPPAPNKCDVKQVTVLVLTRAEILRVASPGPDQSATLQWP
jgi:hypothetical protein